MSHQDIIELLQARVSALDSATLDQVEARLQVTHRSHSLRGKGGFLELIDKTSCNLCNFDSELNVSILRCSVLNCTQE